MFLVCSKNQIVMATSNAIVSATFMAIRRAFGPRSVCDHLPPETVVLCFFLQTGGPLAANRMPRRLIWSSFSTLGRSMGRSFLIFSPYPEYGVLVIRAAPPPHSPAPPAHPLPDGARVHRRQGLPRGEHLPSGVGARHDWPMLTCATRKRRTASTP